MFALFTMYNTLFTNVGSHAKPGGETFHEDEEAPLCSPTYSCMKTRSGKLKRRSTGVHLYTAAATPAGGAANSSVDQPVRIFILQLRPLRYCELRVKMATSMTGGLAVGIDLSTTNSRVAVWRDGFAEVIANGQSKNSTPSCMVFTSTGCMLISDVALNSTNTIFGEI